MMITAAASERAQRRAAGGLRRAGLGVGDRVVLSLPPSADLLAVTLGALRSGVVPVMLDAALTAGEYSLIHPDDVSTARSGSHPPAARRTAGHP
jgi:acyl-CoA synthetase (AMP-forming)/AMP-acid ligase II